MSVFTWPPSWGARQSVKPTVMLARFGDGYEQRVADGINNKPRNWSLSFTRAIAEIDAIESFLSSAGAAAAFDWTPPSGAAGKFVCDQWDREIQSPSAHTLTATFREVFEP